MFGCWNIGFVPSAQSPCACPNAKSTFNSSTYICVVSDAGAKTQSVRGQGFIRSSPTRPWPVCIVNNGEDTHNGPWK